MFFTVNVILHSDSPASLEAVTVKANIFPAVIFVGVPLRVNELLLVSYVMPSGISPLNCHLRFVPFKAVIVMLSDGIDGSRVIAMEFSLSDGAEVFTFAVSDDSAVTVIPFDEAMTLTGK